MLKYAGFCYFVAQARGAPGNPMGNERLAWEGFGMRAVCAWYARGMRGWS